jgi:hypothetical protein
MGRGRGITWVGEFENPALVVHVVAFSTVDLPFGRSDERSIISGHAGAAEMPTDAAHVHPSGKRPTFGVSGAVVLLSEDITFGI